MDHRLDGERRQRAERAHQGLALDRGDPRLAQPPDHPLHGRLVGERPGHGPDAGDEIRVVDDVEQPVERRDRLRHDDQIPQAQQAGRERLQLLHGSPLRVDPVGRLERSDRALHLYVHRHHIRPERRGGAARGGVPSPGRGR